MLGVGFIISLIFKLLFDVPARLNGIDLLVKFVSGLVDLGIWDNLSANLIIQKYKFMIRIN